jgi:hypothetical protein
MATYSCRIWQLTVAEYGNLLILQLHNMATYSCIIWQLTVAEYGNFQQKVKPALNEWHFYFM